MISGTCHRGAVRFELAGTPKWLTRCNCSYCARAGGLWAHADMKRISLSCAPDGVIRYVRGDKTLAIMGASIDDSYRTGYNLFSSAIRSMELR